MIITVIDTQTAFISISLIIHNLKSPGSVRFLFSYYHTITIYGVLQTALATASDRINAKYL